MRWPCGPDEDGSVRLCADFIARRVGIGLVSPSVAPWRALITPYPVPLRAGGVYHPFIPPGPAPGILQAHAVHAFRKSDFSDLAVPGLKAPSCRS